MGGVDEANMTMAGRHFNRNATEDAAKKSSTKDKAKAVDEANMTAAGRHFNRLAVAEAEKKEKAPEAAVVDEANMSAAGRHFHRKASGGNEAHTSQANNAPR